MITSLQQLMVIYSKELGRIERETDEFLTESLTKTFKLQLHYGRQLNYILWKKAPTQILMIFFFVNSLKAERRLNS